MNPTVYFVKILQSLNRAGLVIAQKRLGGRYAFNKSLDQISLFDIVDAVDPFTRIKKCPLGIAKYEKLCPLHQKLENAYGDFQKMFENHEKTGLCPHENT